MQRFTVEDLSERLKESMDEKELELFLGESLGCNNCPLRELESIQDDFHIGNVSIGIFQNLN